MKPGIERVQALADTLRSELCCHSNETHAPIANPPNCAQLEGTPFYSPKLHQGPCSSVGMWWGTDTQTAMTTIHFVSCMTHTKCNERNAFVLQSVPHKGSERFKVRETQSHNCCTIITLDIILIIISYVDRAATDSGTVADTAASRKTQISTLCRQRTCLNPAAVENLGTFSTSTLDLLVQLGRRISLQSGDVRESSYLFQRISVAIQRFNSALLHDSLADDMPDS